MLDVSVYYQPLSLTAALELLAQSEAKLIPIAGGTDIVPAIGKGELQVDGLVDLSKIPDLRQISLAGSEVKIGSCCTFKQIETSPIIRENVTLLAEAAAAVGSPQIRNLGTIGGNIANASPAADTVTSLMALDAKVRLECLAGSRTVLVSEILCGAGKTNIHPQEIITEITFSTPPAGSKTGFIKLGRRKALAIARMNLAIILTLCEERIISTRIALGAVGANPCRNTALENSLLGQKPSLALVEVFVSEAEREVARMLGSRASAAYKRTAVKGIARDLLSRLFADSGQVVV